MNTTSKKDAQNVL